MKTRDPFDDAVQEAFNLLPQAKQRRAIQRKEGLISMEKDASGETLFGRTEIGKAIYDLLLSSMSAKKAGERHHVRHAAVLALRRNYRALRRAA
jgi:hypothetical protein